MTDPIAQARAEGHFMVVPREAPQPRQHPPARFLNNSRPIVTQELSDRIVQDLGESDGMATD